MLVAVDFGRCMVIRYSLRPVQLGKCPLLMARISLEGTWINRLVCRKEERSNLLASDWMALQKKFVGCWYLGLVALVWGEGGLPRVRWCTCVGQ